MRLSKIKQMMGLLTPPRETDPKQEYPDKEYMYGNFLLPRRLRMAWREKTAEDLVRQSVDLPPDEDMNVYSHKGMTWREILAFSVVGVVVIFGADKMGWIGDKDETPASPTPPPATSGTDTDTDTDTDTISDIHFVD